MSFPTDVWQSTNIDQDDNPGAPDPGPDGKATFDVALDDARAFVSKAGNAVIVLNLRVVGGPLDNYQWGEVRGLKSEGQIKAAKATCARIGVGDLDTVTGIEDLESRLKEHVGTYYEIEVVQNGEYRNVYFQGKSTPSDVPNDLLPSKQEAAAAIAGATAEEDIPF